MRLLGVPCRLWDAAPRPYNNINWLLPPYYTLGPARLSTA